jgi:hypothetical protein
MSQPMPINGQDLLDIHAVLGAAHLNDPALAIQNAIAWLCPYLIIGDDPWEWWDETPRGEVLCALLTCKNLFPEVYDSAILLFDADFEKLYWHLCNGINRAIGPNIEIWELSNMAHGIPIFGFGADAGDFDWRDDHRDCSELLDLFGVSTDDAHRWNGMGGKMKVMRVLSENLLGEKPPLPGETLSPKEAIGWFLRWLFSSTGEDLADWTSDALMEDWGVERHAWTPDVLQAVRQAHEDACSIYEAAQRGRDVIARSPEWNNALIDNWNYVEEKLENGRTPARRAIRWPRDSRVLRRGETPHRA